MDDDMDLPRTCPGCGRGYWLASGDGG
jgi:hypothetical protein